MGHGLHRGRWTSVVLATVALCGLLAMHGFEATLVHPGHAGPTGHVDGAHVSFAEMHLHGGTCSLDLPDSLPEPPALCTHAWLDAQPRSAPHRAAPDPWSIANRAVLTAHSILRV